ncbi:ribose-phosphate pyrophosphokinase [Candidatus Woesearchaeota archaeon]|nr:ribose-phosphate pyrophosphokinase [Candidatus Woesearchaeota archaeon]
MFDIHNRIKIFSGSSNKPLAKEIADYLKLPLGKITLKKFLDGEIFARINETVRGVDIFVLQSTCSPVNNNLMELSIIVDALRRASARRITVVTPYFGYGRQDRKAHAREPITAKLVANLLTATGADRIVTIDLHSDQIQGFFDIPLDHLTSLPIIANYLEKKRLKNMVIVSPDAGGVRRARRLAKILKKPLVILDKRREEHNAVAEVHVIGNIKGKTAVFVDDMIDTAGTMIQAVSAVFERGAKEAYICATHPLFSGPAISRIKESKVKEIIVTNTIPLPKEKQTNKIKQLSVAALLAETIKNIHEESSVSVLFKDDYWVDK